MSGAKRGASPVDGLGDDVDAARARARRAGQQFRIAGADADEVERAARRKVLVALVTDYWVTGRRGAQTRWLPTVSRRRDVDAGEITAEAALAMRVERLLGIEGDSIGDEATTGLQRVPASIEQLVVGDVAAEEDGVGRGHADEAVGGVAVHDLEGRDAESAGVDGDHLQALAFALEGDGLGIAGGAHPFDGDRAAAGADIPEQRAGKGRELGERRGADLALGQLAIGDEGVVGEAGDGRQQGAPGSATQSMART